MLELERQVSVAQRRVSSSVFHDRKFQGMLIHLRQPMLLWHLPHSKLEAMREVNGEPLGDVGNFGWVACHMVVKCISKLTSAARAVPVGWLPFRERNSAIYAKGLLVWDGYVELVACALIDLRVHC